MRSTSACSPKSTIKTPAKVAVNAHMPPARVRERVGRHARQCPLWVGPAILCASPQNRFWLWAPTVHCCIAKHPPSPSCVSFPAQPQQMGINCGHEFSQEAEVFNQRASSTGSRSESEGGSDPGLSPAS